MAGTGLTTRPLTEEERRSYGRNRVDPSCSECEGLGLVIATNEARLDCGAMYLCLTCAGDGHARTL